MRQPAADVIVIGAGIVGAAVAYHASAAGMRVTVVERGAPASGTTSGGEGNVLVSDKGPGPELDLALLSRRIWDAIGDDLGAASFELEAKGGVMVTSSDTAAAALRDYTAGQRAAGVTVDDIGPDRLRELEPNLTPDLAGGAWYPQDAQVQPMLAAARMLERARARGAVVHAGTAVTGVLRAPGGAVTGVTTDAADVPSVVGRWVVNAAGPWSGEIAAMAGVPIPVLPRRGFVLITEPLPRAIRHKVYSADYVANVASSSAGLETSVVVEGTRSGTILIGASRERVGFDRTVSIPVLRRLAAGAVGLFPFLADVALLRTYLGFRPYCPDHLPVIGEDPRAPGLVHAAGHEGAGIVLAPATGHLVAQVLAGATPDMDLTPFRPGRFAEATAAEGHAS